MWTVTVLVLALTIYCGQSLEVSEQPVKVCRPDATSGSSQPIASDPTLMKQTYEFSEGANGEILKRPLTYTNDGDITTAQVNNKIVFDCQLQNNAVDDVEDVVIPHLSKAVEYANKFSRSCKEVLEKNPSAESGNYLLRLNNGSIAEAYCDMVGLDCENLGGWTRIGYFNMADENYNSCPSPLVSKSYSILSNPLCQRASTGIGCDSIYFDNLGIEYTSVCGRAMGYQFGSPDGIKSWSNIDDNYVDGLSITYSSPRKHIWTYIGGYNEGLTWSNCCPCNTGSFKTVPSFVGNDYYCEAGLESGQGWTNKLYNDRLWDGELCRSLETPCCNNNAPWFSKLLSDPTDDQIEVRACDDEVENNERTPLEAVEIYIR